MAKLQGPGVFRRCSVASPDAQIKAAAARLKAMSQNTANISPAVKQAALEIGAFIHARFQRQVDPTGRPWAKLAQSTIEGRARRAGALKTTKKGAYTTGARQKQAVLFGPGGIIILADTGELKRMTSVVPEPRSILIRSNIDYAAVHQEGTNRAGRNHNIVIPARPFVPLHSHKGWGVRLWREGEAGVLWHRVESILQQWVSLRKVTVY